MTVAGTFMALAFGIALAAAMGLRVFLPLSLLTVMLPVLVVLLAVTGVVTVYRFLHELLR